ncbi:unnamed protein product [Lota lota]
MFSTKALTVTGKVGETVRIECSHTNAVSNVKYFCNYTCRDQDVLISSRSRKVPFLPSKRYSIEDKGNTFFITIRDLRLEDTGNYWCGIDRVTFDTYVNVYLKINNVGNSDVHTVKETVTTEFKPTERPTDFENESSQGESIAANLYYPLTYIGAALGVAVLVLALVLLIFCRLKRRRTVFPSDKNQGTNESLENQKRNGPLPASLTNPHPDSSIYANVSGFPKPQDQPDESVSVPSSPEQPSVFYSTVNYNYGSTSVALITDTESVMYSTIKITQGLDDL